MKKRKNMTNPINYLYNFFEYLFIFLVRCFLYYFLLFFFLDALLCCSPYQPTTYSSLQCIQQQHSITSTSHVASWVWGRKSSSRFTYYIIRHQTFSNKIVVIKIYIALLMADEWWHSIKILWHFNWFDTNDEQTVRNEKLKYAGFLLSPLTFFSFLYLSGFVECCGWDIRKSWWSWEEIDWEFYSQNTFGCY